MRALRHTLGMTLALLLLGCGGDDSGGNGPPPVGSPAPSPAPTPTPSPTPAPTPTPTPTPTTSAVTQRIVASFSNPWAMVFLPDGRLLVTERQGALFLVTTAGAKTQVTGVPSVVFANQIGLHDIVLDPSFATNSRVWLSYAEGASGGQRIAVASATLNLAGTPALQNLSVVWRSTPATTGGHLAARLAFAPNGNSLFVSTGDRQQGAPAQDLATTLGKMIRINLDGTPFAGNPFASNPNARPEIFSYGQRNPLGIVFAADGRLFSSEMGPSGGDEFNLIAGGSNYGWPLASEGNNYDGSLIPRHATNAAFTAPLVTWSTIAPAGIIQYRGTRFAGWTDDFLIAGLVQQGIVRVRVTGNTAQEVGRIGLGARIREVEQGPDGRIWVLQDGGTANLVELSPG
ncbi:PQQ-dependent sugar dehydrogenase [Erythrobacter donghaensis]|uniref:PQQ-dependent sugar dehydrogenase n=2 Tax=Erythrobacter donghaensis TaxID=267135 RepID=UPI00093A47BB|nr:PQQ-dependent sugar dehydrogenase [Erythrobacter donghaensis]